VKAAGRDSIAAIIAGIITKYAHKKEVHPLFSEHTH
jgi:hypothetical protein